MNYKPVPPGTKGVLIRLASDLGYVFRVYHKDYTFTDYDILHYDMNVTITDDDAYFYEDDDKTWIDHSPLVLGHKE